MNSRVNNVIIVKAKENYLLKNLNHAIFVMAGEKQDQMIRFVQAVVELVTCNIMIPMIVISVPETGGFMMEWNKFYSESDFKNINNKYKKI